MTTDKKTTDKKTTDKKTEPKKSRGGIPMTPKELAEYEQTWINMENVSKNLDEQYSKRKSKK